MAPLLPTARVETKLSDVPRSARIWVVMGVSGSGKTTLGIALAERLGCAFQDADDLHPASNIEKMRSGQALTDADRMPWLEGIAAWMIEQANQGRQNVLACSALKRRYRDRMRESGCAPLFVAIDADLSIVANRLARRTGHFMSSPLLDSQIADYERPSPDEGALFVAADLPVEKQVDVIVASMV